MVTPAAEKAIQDGLAFLAAHQQEDGSFGTGGYRGNVALCGLAGLALISSGSTPDRGPYGAQVSKCVDYLLLHAKESGFIVQAESAGYGPMYGHGYATLFLAECHGMSQRLGLRDKLTKAVALIVDTQNKDGGWRYQPQRLDADISVTVTQVMALRAAKNAGIHVAQETIDRCIDYVRRSQNPDGGFMYMISGGESGFARSAAGVVALQSAGIYEGPEITKGLAYLMTFLPQADVRPAGELLLLRPLLRRAGHVARRRREVEPLVPGRPRRADRQSAPRRLLERSDLRRLRHRHGPAGPPDPEQLLADLPAVK